MSDFSVSYERVISAPIDSVQEQINDLHQWENWSPWQLLDPDMDQQYFGADRGVGAKMTWTGNKQAGAGSMEVITDQPGLVEVDLKFLKPFKAENRSHFYLTSVSEGETRVKWELTGKQNFLMKIMFRLFKMEKNLQNDFAKGLNRLATVVEN